MSKEKWTNEMRSILYRSLVYYFGDYQGYKSASLDEKVEHFNKIKYVLDALTANGKPLKSIGAISQQVAWALTKQEQVDENNIPTWHHNVSAALESGFYKSNYADKIILRGSR